MAEEDPYIRHTTNVTTQVIEIDYSKEEGEAELHDTMSDDARQESEPQTSRQTSRQTY